MSHPYDSYCALLMLLAVNQWWPRVNHLRLYVRAHNFHITSLTINNEGLLCMSSRLEHLQWLAKHLWRYVSLLKGEMLVQICISAVSMQNCKVLLFWGKYCYLASCAAFIHILMVCDVGYGKTTNGGNRWACLSNKKLSPSRSMVSDVIKYSA